MPAIFETASLSLPDVFVVKKAFTGNPLKIGGLIIGS
jgi:hypothetical protein